MQKPLPEESDAEVKQQQTGKAGRDVTIVGHDYQRTTNFNLTVFLIGVLALGGLAWAIYVGNYKPAGNQQNQVSPEAIQKQTP